MLENQLNEEERSNAKLTLIGKGPELSNLERIITQEELPNEAVEIVPWVAQQQFDRIVAHGAVSSSGKRKKLKELSCGSHECNQGRHSTMI